MLISAATRLFRRDIQTTEAITPGKATRSIRRCICGDKTRERRITTCSPCIGFSPYQPRRIAAVMRVLCPEGRGIMRGYSHSEATGLPHLLITASLSLTYRLIYAENESRRADSNR